SPFEVAQHVLELVFHTADADQSEHIDQAEFVEALRQLGCSIALDVARHCLASYDIDRSRTVEIGEFVDFMTHEFLVHIPPPPGYWCEPSAAGRPWEIPKGGKLRMTVVADHVAPAHAEVASADAVEAVISNIRFSAKTEQDRLEMFHLATEASIESHLK
ncbi:unnamed protein product, partial [Sphacelaria rigidula]